MSSIDKYVMDEAMLCDSRIRVSNRNGRIIGKINGETVFNIADRYGYLSDDEKKQIHAEIGLYKQREYEERIRKEEEERRRKEEERQKELENLQNEINNKLQIVNTNIANLQNVYKGKKTSIVNLNNNIEEIRQILPYANLEGLKNKNNNLLENLENKYLSSNNDLMSIKSNIQNIQKMFNKNSEVVDLIKAKKELTKISLNFKNFSFGTEIEMIKNEINDSKKNAKNLANIIKESNIITDDFIKNQIYQEINNINIIDEKKINFVLKSVENRIEAYKFSLGREKTDQQIKEFNRLEALIKSTKELIEYNVKDTYSLNNISENIRELVAVSLEKLNKLMKIPYKVSDMNINEIQSQLYQKMINPINSDEEQKWLTDLIYNLDSQIDKASLYKMQYDEFVKLKEELKEFGVIDNQEFDCNNSLRQLQDLESKIILQMEEAELGNLYDTYFKIIESMQETNYEIFKTDNDQYSIEVYFINKKYPGVLTRFVINNNGSFRRSLIGLKIDDYATEINEIVEISKEMENDVDKFLTSFENLTGKETNITDSVLFDDDNSIERIYENGYFELNDEGKARYNQFMGIENVVISAKNDKKRFGCWNENVHKIKDTRIERDAIRETSQSYQRRRN